MKATSCGERRNASARRGGRRRGGARVAGLPGGTEQGTADSTRL